MAINRNFVCGLLVIALAAAYYVMISGIQTSLLADDVGPDGLPRIYAFALGALGLVLAWRSRPRRGVEGDASTAAKDWFQLRRAGGMLAIGVFYLISAQIAGYILSITLVILIGAIYQGTKATPKLALIAILGALGLWCVFVWLLHIQQPVGLLPWLR